MWNSFSVPRFARAVVVALPILTGITLGCSDAPPTRPSETFSVTRVSPTTGPAGSSTELSIIGTGFEPGASVTIGGAATSVRVVRSTLIIADTPISPVGKVDVVVTNANGQSGRLAGAFEYLGLALTEVSPRRGLSGDLVSIVGSGFSAGTGLTIGGADTQVIQRTSTVLTALAPSMPSGSVDVTVANPNGERQTLTQAFTFDIVAISASPSAVAVGGSLSVTFGAPNGRPASDWVGLFRAGDANEHFLWYEYTGGSPHGTIIIPAPTPPGDYQFRYFANDGYIDAARSGLVTVIDAGGMGVAAASVRAMPTPTAPLKRPGRGRGR